jgi:hypothetical protein
MRILVEDLESLKEINDELEENHIETEKQMQSEIGIILPLHNMKSYCRYQGQDNQGIQKENGFAGRYQRLLRTDTDSIP